jgi:hypothetical protein
MTGETVLALRSAETTNRIAWPLDHRPTLTMLLGHHRAGHNMWTVPLSAVASIGHESTAESGRDPAAQRAPVSGACVVVLPDRDLQGRDVGRRHDQEVAHDAREVLDARVQPRELG